MARWQFHSSQPTRSREFYPNQKKWHYLFYFPIGHEENELEVIDKLSQTTLVYVDKCHHNKAKELLITITIEDVWRVEDNFPPKKYFLKTIIKTSSSQGNSFQIWPQFGPRYHIKYGIDVVYHIGSGIPNLACINDSFIKE